MKKTKIRMNCRIRKNKTVLLYAAAWILMFCAVITWTKYTAYAAAAPSADDTETVFESEWGVHVEYGNRIMKYRGSSAVVNVPESINGSTITEISSRCFADNPFVTDVILPDTVRWIDDYAFSNCTSLRHVHLPASLEVIANYAFENCHQLQEIRFPDSLRKIGTAAFLNCRSLTEVTIPSGVRFPSPDEPYVYETVSSSIFDRCISLRKVVFEADNLPHGMFGLCIALEEIEITGKVEVIPPGAFSACSGLKRAGLPETLRRIESGAFSECESLTSITIPPAVEKIGYQAFLDTNIRTFYIPASVTSIGDAALSSTESLEVDPGNPVYSSKDGVLYNKQQTRLIGYPMRKKAEVFRVPAGVEIIGYGAFCAILSDDERVAIQKVILPESLVSLEDSTGISYCNEGIEIYAPKSLKVIGNYNLPRHITAKWYYTGTKEDWGKIRIGSQQLEGSVADVVMNNPYDREPVSYKDYNAVFDSVYYADRYADLKKAYGYDREKLLNHFVRYGMKEGRQASEDFDVRYYRNTYADLRKAYGSDLQKYYTHYVDRGRAEGRRANEVIVIEEGHALYNGIDYAAVFDSSWYMSRYPDLRSAFGQDKKALLRHFVLYGMKEGRQGCASFCVQSYRNEYRDLRRRYAGSLPQYYLHYIRCGRAEGRHGTGCAVLKNPETVYQGTDYAAVYDFYDYLKYNPDVEKAYGRDENRVLRHFVVYGMQETRRAKASFSVRAYRARYRDLQAAFVDDWKKYYLHYIGSGQREGRNAA